MQIVVPNKVETGLDMRLLSRHDNVFRVLAAGTRFARVSGGKSGIAGPERPECPDGLTESMDG
jgi:hypothetical protein